MRLLVSTFLLSIYVFTSNLAFPGSFNDVLILFERAEFSEALEIITPLADKGDANAQYELGVMYF